MVYELIDDLNHATCIVCLALTIKVHGASTTMHSLCIRVRCVQVNLDSQRVYESKACLHAVNNCKEDRQGIVGLFQLLEHRV